MMLPLANLVEPPLPRFGAFPLRIAEVVSSLSVALDYADDLPMGHAVRTCSLGMEVAREIGFPLASKSELYYSLLLRGAAAGGSVPVFRRSQTGDAAVRGDRASLFMRKIGLPQPCQY